MVTFWVVHYFLLRFLQELLLVIFQKLVGDFHENLFKYFPIIFSSCDTSTSILLLGIVLLLGLLKKLLMIFMQDFELELQLNSQGCTQKFGWIFPQ